MDDIINKFINSWRNVEGNVNTTANLFDWITELNKKTFVGITEAKLDNDAFWFYDKEQDIIRNKNNSFFTIVGVKEYVKDVLIKEQPIIIQDEIGFLGIIAKEVDGEINLLIQAKIEPGNINTVQLSPTIQATKSNFTQAHGGLASNYLEYFVNASHYEIILDQIQSEQGARFNKKRNRNMIVLVNEDVEIKKNFAWMTLGQVKELMKIDNLVNMDTRTVISGIPFGLNNEKVNADLFSDIALFNSLYKTNPINNLGKIYNKINDNKMFNDTRKEIVPLSELGSWDVNDNGVFPMEDADFLVQYYDIEIEGREVRKWQQPLFKAKGIATFGLIMKNISNVKHFLVKIEKEIGSFDILELGPTILWESTHKHDSNNDVDELFKTYVNDHKGIKYSVILSEEGGRFYHEQNKNYIIEIDEDELKDIPAEYLWVDLATLIYMIQFNNTCNIQLRNLISLLTI